MTTGERIAQKRKELGMSQEALGEKMGVSRQAIYKWESDAALPEIEKLINLSREFSVSVGWLLGEEDEKKELTQEQLAMVEEIVGRYLDARGAEQSEDEDGGANSPKQKRLRRLRTVSAGLILLGAVATAANLFSRLDQVTNNYGALQRSVNNISTSVSYQIDSITRRVEEILQKQNDLTAEQCAEVVSTDYLANTVTISVRALPRTFTEGMTAEFLLESGGESFAVPGVLGDDHAFTAEITVPLSDDIPVSVALITGDQRQTQLLNEFFSLYGRSFPSVEMLPMLGGLWGSGKTVEPDVTLRVEPETLAQIDSLRLGLFRDRKLVAWYEQLDGKPANYGGDRSDYLFFRLNEEQTMEPGHIYCQAMIVTDQYGRERVYPGLSVEYDPDNDIAEYLDTEDAYTYYVCGIDPTGWLY